VRCVSRPTRRRARRLPARVYWVRRGLVLGVVVLLGWALVGLLPGGAGGDAAEVTPPATATPPAPTDEPGGDPRGDPDGEPGAAPAAGSGPAQSAEGADRPAGRPSRPAVVTTTLDGADGECDPAEVLVEPAVTGTAVAGRAVDVLLTVATTGPFPCRLALGPESVLVQVAASGGAAIWDTGQCPDALPDRSPVLRPGWQVAVEVAWSGRLGDRTCSRPGEAASPGTYAVRAAAFGGEPRRSDFVLSATPSAAAPPAAPSERRGAGVGGQT